MSIKWIRISYSVAGMGLFATAISRAQLDGEASQFRSVDEMNAVATSAPASSDVDQKSFEKLLRTVSSGASFEVRQASLRLASQRGPRQELDELVRAVEALAWRIRDIDDPENQEFYDLPSLVYWFLSDEDGAQSVAKRIPNPQALLDLYYSVFAKGRIKYPHIWHPTYERIVECKVDSSVRRELLIRVLNEMPNTPPPPARAA